MEFKSIDPYNAKVVGTYQTLTEVQVEHALSAADHAFLDWRKVPLNERCLMIERAGEVLLEHIEDCARMITLEMGKPITESRAEIKKCATVCAYYATHAEWFLTDKIISTEASVSMVQHAPLGTVFAIMPWNFPFWQVFRFAAPTLTAGNTAVLKHASNVFGCALLIEGIFKKAGFPEGVFQSLIIHHNMTEQIIANEHVKAVTLTGSERAGSAVAALAGKYIKKSVLELGGSNAFIVWPDADMDQTISTAVNARMLNSGQSCIAAKRFILVGESYDTFVPRFIQAVKELKSGDPMDEASQVGPLARKDLADKLQEQVQASIAKGAELLLGGGQNGCYHEPTVLGNVTPGMPAFDEETFGPLAAMIRAKDIDEAFELSEKSRLGLGVTVCTRDTEKALSMSHMVSDGAYFINELVKSDARLPFGGTKYSGYGRELSKDGIMEFVNRKTIYVK
ncbi:MAG: NAD-dependent succinate-semialdehyde dehydrogenase [Bacteroidetes bacterium]|jgi:succinate-semialdehyde dehydrogenase / glutarate-semialdehyde dehydrogenase|nr:NAD-dependent succinate-semialdehyde dehydrogenase [Bacteroidota bacterium]